MCLLGCLKIYQKMISSVSKIILSLTVPLRIVCPLQTLRCSTIGDYVERSRDMGTVTVNDHAFNSEVQPKNILELHPRWLG